jgi:hypothetical protein
MVDVSNHYYRTATVIGCNHCKQQWKQLESTRQAAHLSAECFAREQRVSFCNESVLKIEESFRADLMKQFEDLERKGMKKNDIRPK